MRQQRTFLLGQPPVHVRVRGQLVDGHRFKPFRPGHVLVERTRGLQRVGIFGRSLEVVATSLLRVRMGSHEAVGGDVAVVVGAGRTVVAAVAGEGAAALLHDSLDGHLVQAGPPLLLVRCSGGGGGGGRWGGGFVGNLCIIKTVWLS